MNDFYKALAQKGQMLSPACPKRNNAVTDAAVWFTGTMLPSASRKNALLRHAAAGQKGKEGFVLKKFPVVPEKAETHGLVTVGFYFLIVKYSTPPSSRKSSNPYPMLSQNDGMLCLVLMSSVITCKDWPDFIFSKVRSVTTFGRGHASPLTSSVLSTFGFSPGMAVSLSITA
jgi:hypothetical protein